MKYFLSLALILPTIVLNAQQNLIVGTYTSKNSKGIYLLNFNDANGILSPISVTNTTNPSFLTASKNKKFLFAVNEMQDSTREDMTGYVSSFFYNQKFKKYENINHQPTMGVNPCYVSLTKDNKWLFVGNYTGGSVSVFAVNTNGSLKPAHQTIQHVGKSINEKRQESAHVHATFLSPNEKFLYVPDLGMDKIMIYSFNNKTGLLKIYDSVTVKAGSGPRHIEFNKNGTNAYLLEELTGNVNVYKVYNGKLVLTQTVNSLPQNYTSLIGSADIHLSPDGKFLYTTNRGGESSNTISTFAVHKTNGSITYLQSQSSGGIKPRNFTIHPSGSFILVANQVSDNIVVFKRNKLTGILTAHGKPFITPTPVCLIWQ
jgi:6-phosphogluconolactonase